MLEPAGVSSVPMQNLLADDSIVVGVQNWPEAVASAALFLAIAWVIVAAIKSDRWRD